MITRHSAPLTRIGYRTYIHKYIHTYQRIFSMANLLHLTLPPLQRGLQAWHKVGIYIDNYEEKGQQPLYVETWNQHRSAHGWGKSAWTSSRKQCACRKEKHLMQASDYNYYVWPHLAVESATPPLPGIATADVATQLRLQKGSFTQVSCEWLMLLMSTFISSAK